MGALDGNLRLNYLSDTSAPRLYAMIPAGMVEAEREEVEERTWSESHEAVAPGSLTDRLVPRIQVGGGYVGAGEETT